MDLNLSIINLESNKYLSYSVSNIEEGISDNEAWNFAAGAYNAGMGNIAKAIEKAGSVSKWDHVAAVLPEITGKYSSETIRYVNCLRA